MCFPHMENEEEKKLWKTMDDGKNIGVASSINRCVVNVILKFGKRDDHESIGCATRLEEWHNIY